MARGQKRTLIGGMTFGILWMAAQAFIPAILGLAIDEGIAARDGERLLQWTAVLFAVGVLQAIAGIMRHRFAVTNWLTAAYRTVQVVPGKSSDLGATLPKHLATGEVVSVGAGDLAYVGNLMEVSARVRRRDRGVRRGRGDPALLVDPLGLVVLIGVPVMLLCLGPMLRPLHKRQSAQREAVRRAELARLRHRGRSAGAARHRRRGGLPRPLPQRVAAGPAAGVRVAGSSPCWTPLRCCCPASSWCSWSGSARTSRCAATLSAGSLVAFYGYATFLVLPLRTATEFANKLMRGLVAARSSDPGAGVGAGYRRAGHRPVPPARRG